MTEPTPGPWKARYNGSCWQIDAEHDAVATTQFCYAPAGEANARLIATAPDLYAALTDVLSAWEDKSGMGTVFNMQRAIPDARRALAKARGEP
jgi:hypothetical protein